MKSISLILAASLAAAASVAVTGCISEDGLELGEVFEELDVSQWTDDVRIPNQSTARQPGVAWFNNRVHMVHSGSGDPRQLWYSVRDEATKAWSPNRKLGVYLASGGPSLVVWNGQLTLIYLPWANGAQAFELMMYPLRSNGTNGPGTRLIVGRDIRSAPSAAVVAGKLYVGYCAKNGSSIAPHVAVLDSATGVLSTTWSEPGAGDCRTVAIGAGEGESLLHVAWTTSAPWGWPIESWRVRTSKAVIVGGNAVWDQDAIVQPMMSKKPMSIVTCNGVTHLVHGGNADPNGIYWSVFQHGSWRPDARVPDQASDGGAQLGCAGGTAFMIHNGGYDDLWYSEFR